MQTVMSKDGTRIAFWRSGGGPPLLLVHGSTADHTTTWRLVLPALERKFTVYAMDRRGRGGSGDSPAYELLREAEDVAAVIESIGEPVNVLGHSQGALYALEAALLTAKMRRAILYEGVPLRGADDLDPAVIDRLDALLGAGDVEAVLVGLLRDVAEMRPQDIEQLRAQRDAWKVRLDNARTVPRELRVYARYTFAAERFKGTRTPMLFLVGGDSPSRELQSATEIAKALPSARVVALPGHQHTAMHSAPALFVQEVERFFEV